MRQDLRKHCTCCGRHIITKFSSSKFSYIIGLRSFPFVGLRRRVTETLSPVGPFDPSFTSFSLRTHSVVSVWAEACRFYSKLSRTLTYHIAMRMIHVRFFCMVQQRLVLVGFTHDLRKHFTCCGQHKHYEDFRMPVFGLRR